MDVWSIMVMVKVLQQVLVQDETAGNQGPLLSAMTLPVTEIQELATADV